MKLYSKWNVTPPPDEAAVRRVAALAGVSPIVARLLVSRGITEPEAARAFLTADLDSLHDPMLLPDMDKAVERVAQAVRRGEKTAVYGDYDVDGQTSTALLVRGLAALGLRPDWYIPERVAEGYGLNQAAVDELGAAGVRLLITVDCGIQASAEVARAQAVGMDVIITDHHEPGDTLPPARAVVNPKRRDSRYPFRELAGVGVAYKLLQAVWDEFGAGPLPVYALELAALGTVADVCPLIDENRVLVRAGLRQMNREPLAGVAALMDVAAVRPGEVTAGQVGYVLGPRLNAAGRVSHAATGVELLLCDDESTARRLAAQLDRENESRRAMEAEILDEALAKIEQEDMLSHWVLVVDGEGWHPGVIGIVASRLVDRFARPAIVIGYDGDTGKGSGRSIRGFDLFHALSGCADVLERFGGHQMAAGLTVRRELVPELRRRLNDAAADLLGPADLVPETRVDLEVRLGDVTEQLALELEQLAPFGPLNPTPVLAAPRALVVGARRWRAGRKPPETHPSLSRLGYRPRGHRVRRRSPPGFHSAGQRGAGRVRHPAVGVARAPTRGDSAQSVAVTLGTSRNGGGAPEAAAESARGARRGPPQGARARGGPPGSRPGSPSGPGRVHGHPERRRSPSRGCAGRRRGGGRFLARRVGVPAWPGSGAGMPCPTGWTSDG